MGQGVKQTQGDYSLTFKLALAEQIEKGELICQETQARYGIQGNSTSLVWLRKYGLQERSQGDNQRACERTYSRCVFHYCVPVFIDRRDKPALAGTGCTAIHHLWICDGFQGAFAEYASGFGFSSQGKLPFLSVIFCHFPVIPSR